jgi:hypothetical protein
MLIGDAWRKGMHADARMMCVCVCACVCACVESAAAAAAAVQLGYVFNSVSLLC